MRQLAKKTVSIGQVFLVPVGAHGFIPGKVLFVESQGVGAILVALYAAIVRSKSAPIDLPENFDRLLYTTPKPILKGRWPSVAIHELRHNETGLSKRLIGDSVWIENEKIRIASDEELSTIKSMDVCNISWVEEESLEIAAKLSE